MRARRRSTDDNILPFLDVIACSFGSVVLLLLLAGRGDVAESVPRPPESLLSQQTLLFALRAEASALRRQLARLERLLSTQGQELARRRREAERQAASERDTEQYRDALEVARQKLYQAHRERELNQPDQVSGLPVDSRYVIFVIDTSGSMLRYAWRDMVRLMNDILSSYPALDGLQVINDMGEYMFPYSRRQWLEDSAGRRAGIARALANWRAFSNSSPLEGIVTALRDYSRDIRQGRRLSLYVFGDSFAGEETIPEALAIAEEMNPAGADGLRAARIHAVGFPVDLDAEATNLLRYAVLMREMTQRHNGTFIGLNALR